MCEGRVDAARRATDARFDAGRSLAGLSDQDSLADAPHVATVAHVREASAEVAAASDPDEGGAMACVAGRRSPDCSAVVASSPLGLVPPSGVLPSFMLADATTTPAPAGIHAYVRILLRRTKLPHVKPSRPDRRSLA